tara:strand:- start:188 stop:478 length:291 start_codon:yes stop_codon:yes gene_type:complete
MKTAYKSNLFSREKNPYGQKKSQQNRIKNIFKTMKKQDIEVKQEYAQKRFNDFVNSNKKSNQKSPDTIKDTIYKSKVQQSMKNINRQLDKLEREIL